MILFRPSEKLVNDLFKYHKATRKGIKIKTLTKELVSKVQEEMGHSFRRALVVFGYRILEMPIPLCAIIEQDKPGFTAQMNEILQRYLGIGSDTRGAKLIERFAQEFSNWLEGMESLEAEEKDWPYKRVYLIDKGTVIMDLNQRANVALKVH